MKKASTHRRWRLGFMLAVVFLVLSVPQALAVHDLGLFELEGDAFNDAAVPGDDWNQVFAGTSSAFATKFVTDQTGVFEDIFTTGGSKDVNDVSEWRWTNGTVPDKDDILHAYAASYVDPVSGDTIVYFGADRFDTSGDSAIGFWFFKEPVSTEADFTFDGAHKIGDTFVVSDFTQGGTISTVKVYEWAGADGAAGHLELTTTAGVDCSGSVSGDDVCALVNSDVESSPWPYADKDGETSFQPGAFYEGGLNLSDLFGGNENVPCFSSFLAETRSSQSTTAQLKDFALGAFDICGEITVRKNSVPDDAQNFAYTTTGTGLSSFSLDDDADPTLSNVKTFEDLKPGPYSVQESLPVSGWDLTDLQCTATGPGTSATKTLATGKVDITLGPAGQVDCTYTNTKKPKLTVNKVLIPSSDSGKFNLQIDGTTYAADVGDGGTTGPQFVSVGSHTVGETAGTGTSLSDYTTVIGGDCAANGTVSLAAGDNKTCTITNTRRPKLTVNKVLIPSSDSGKFNLRIDGTTYAANVGDGGTTGAQNVSIGSHVVSETAGTGTSLADYTSVISGDCDASGNVTLAAGDNKTCTITNTRRPKLTVVKLLNPTSDSGKFNLQIDGTTYATNVGHNGSTGAQYVSIGTHSASETAGTGTNLADYFPAVFGGDCDASGNVTLAAGDNKTCTITNTRRPKLTVNKVLIPSSDSGKFNLQIDGTTYAADVGDGGTTGAQFVSLGSHTVGETAGTGTSLSDYSTVISGDCASNGTVSLAAGDNKTCTITNTRRPRLTVNKVLLPSSDSGKFNLQIDGTTYAANVGDGGTTGAQFVSIGSHTVGETAGTGTSLSDYTTVIGGDCAANGTVSLAAGDNKTCTITNTRKGSARVIKTVNGSPPSGSQFFPFELRQNASPTMAGTLLESLDANAANGGILNFTTKLVAGQTYQLCEIVMPGWMTTLGPSPFVLVINGDNSRICVNFSVGPGETKVFTVDNTPPPGGMARTIGFWKNWASCATSNGKQHPILNNTLASFPIAAGQTTHGVFIGDRYVDTCTEAIRILNKTDIASGKKRSSDPAYNLAAQLLAARLNVQAGAGVCPAAVTAMNSAQALLDAINFTGTGGYTTTMSSSQKTQANNLAITLDRYNNDVLC